MTYLVRPTNSIRNEKNEITWHMGWPREPKRILKPGKRRGEERTERKGMWRIDEAVGTNSGDGGRSEEVRNGRNEMDVAGWAWYSCRKGITSGTKSWRVSCEEPVAPQFLIN